MSERLAAIDAEIERLATEEAPIDAELARLRDALASIGKRMRQLRCEREAEALRLAREEQAEACRREWLRFTNGERDTVRVSLRPDSIESPDVVPLALHGAWVVHESVGYEGSAPGYAYALTHGPSGMRADCSDDGDELAALAAKLAAAVPDFDHTLSVGSPIAERTKAVILAHRAEVGR